MEKLGTYLLIYSVVLIATLTGNHLIANAETLWCQYVAQLTTFIFDERNERSAWVSSRTEVEVAQVRYETLRSLARENPEVVFRLMVQLSHRLRHTNQKVGDLAFTATSGRVARSLLELAKQPEAALHSRGIRVRVTRHELARIAGCSREMVSRVLRTLEERGMIAMIGRDILVLTPLAC